MQLCMVSVQCFTGQPSLHMHMQIQQIHTCKQRPASTHLASRAVGARTQATFPHDCSHKYDNIQLSTSLSSSMVCVLPFLAHAPPPPSPPSPLRRAKPPPLHPGPVHNNPQHRPRQHITQHQPACGPKSLRCCKPSCDLSERVLVVTPRVCESVVHPAAGVAGAPELEVATERDLAVGWRWLAGGQVS